MIKDWSCVEKAACVYCFCRGGFVRSRGGEVEQETQWRKEIGILCGSIAGHSGVSFDGSEWRETPIDWSKHNTPRIIDIPKGLKGDVVRLSLSNESRFECKFFGYALMA
jgi:hypothetical protein